MSRTRRRKLPRWLKRSLIVLACLPVALPVLALTALAIPVTRRPIVALALDLTNDSLEGMRIELDEATRLDLWGIELRGARLFDEKKRQLLSVKRAAVGIAPFALVTGTLHLHDVVVSGVRVRIYPSEPEPEPEPEPESPSSFQIRADRVRVSDTTLDMIVSGKALHAVLERLEARGAYGPQTGAAIQQLQLHADLDGQRAAALATKYASWDEKKGGKFAIEGQVLAAQLSLRAEVPVIDDETAWPLRRAQLDVTGLTDKGLARAGLSEAAQLRVPVDLHVRAQTRGDKGEELTGELALRAGELSLQLSAEATATTYTLHAALPPANLAGVSGILPVLRVGAVLDARVQHAVKPMTGEMAWQKVSLDGRVVPDGSLSAKLPLPILQLTRLDIVGLSRALSLTGQYDLESGAAEASLETRELQLSQFGGLVPEGMRGTLNGGVRAKLDGQSLSGRSDLSLRYFRLTDTRIDNASLALDLSGTLAEPRGDLKLNAYQVDIGKTALLRIAFDAHAGMRDLNGDLSVEGVDRFLSLVLSGVRKPDGSVAIDATGSGRIQDKKIGIQLQQLALGPDGYSVQQLRAFSGRESIYVSGSLNAQDQIDAALAISHLDLEPWARLGLAYELNGELNLTARAQGALDAPDLSAELVLHGVHSARTPRAPKVSLKSKLSLEMAKHRALLELSANSPDRRVVLELKAQAALAKRAQKLVPALEGADVEVALKGHTDLPFLAQFEPTVSDLEGTLDADVRLKGTLDAAELDAEVTALLVPLAEKNRQPRDRIALQVKLRPEALSSTLVVQDPFGKMLDVAAELKLPKGGPRALMADSKTLLHAPAQLKLSLNERRLDKLQGSLGLLARKYGAALPVRSAAVLDVTSDGEAITGKVQARAHVWAEGLDDACAETAEADVTLDVTLSGDRVEAIVNAQPKGGGKAEVTLSSPLSVSSLLDGGAFSWGPAQLVARGDGLALHTMPTLCMLPESRTRFALTAENLGKGPVQSKLELDVDDVPMPEGPKMGLHVSASTGVDAISVQGSLKLASAVKGQFSARVPLSYSDSPVPKLPLDKPVTAELKLPDFPLAGLTSFTTAVGRTGGRIKAALRLAGTLAKPQPSGVIELSDASFSIAALAQPFSDVSGRFELSPDKLIVRSLKARDRSGKIGLTGYAQYNMERGGQAELHLSAEKFPIRQQGSIIGELSTRAELSGKVDASNKLSFTLDIKEGRIWLTGQGGRTVQDLDEHPDVRFDTDRVDLAAEQEQKEARANELTLALLRIKSEKGLWLMHDDFSVQVGVDMKLTTDADGTTLNGEATIARGELNLLGKPFRLDKGAVRFTGDVPPDPELDLKAKHTTRQGQELTVQIQGRASAPQIIFSGAANNAGEAAALLSGIGGSGAESKAKGDAASFAAGLTAGLLAVSARRRFGDWVPMLAVENNAAGAPSGARAGFDASRLIPKFMQGFARGMFVEGVVGSRSDTGASALGVGVRVDVALPRDFMTSMAYGPGTVWSTDVSWSP